MGPAFVTYDGILPRPLLDLLERNRDFWNLFSENSAWHLIFVVLLFFAVFLGRLWWRLRQIDRAREGIPLTIGGWGTRGKSGVERKKAALFHALGYEVLCKTTGCEAMFIHGVPGQPPAELNIFRPYDKATIWEQSDLMTLAHRARAQVFLWECMALNPDYVDILQQDWAKDPITTITNTFPDHEDRQGPAGIDIPEVMCNFIPTEGVCLTAEDQHLPILREGARKRAATLIGVDWRDVDMIPEDVLARYPYNVHPANLALVARMAEHLQIERDFVWKEIADNIIPDLGVLKVYGPVSYRGRRLEFSNGMSANERHGCLGCFARLGLDRINARRDRDTWVVTVVNNRHDRVARSHVFGEMLAKDIKAHAHVCIGTNLSGLRGYALDALERRLQSLSLFDAAAAEDDEREEPPSREEAMQRFSEHLRDLMVETPTLPDYRAKLQAMLEGIGLDRQEAREIAHDQRLSLAVKQSKLTHPEWDLFRPACDRDEDLERQVERMRTEVTTRLGAAAASPDVQHAVADLADFALRYAREYGAIERFRLLIEAAMDQIGAGGGEEVRRSIDAKLRDLFRAVFSSRILFIRDPEASGDEICDQIARWAPPGHQVRIIGIQNIKGTGYDFCLRWVSLEKVQQLCRQLQNDRPMVRFNALLALSTNEDCGVLDAPIALAAVREAKADPRNQEMRMQAQINVTIAHLERRLQLVRARLLRRDADDEPDAASWRGRIEAVAGRVVSALEAALDAGDAKRRKKQAVQIFDDLVAERISHQRAAAELQKLVKRQKGGWLRKALRRRAPEGPGGLPREA